MVEITLYVGLDWKSRIAERMVKEALAILAKEYGVSVEFNLVEIPVDGFEAEREGIPSVIVDGVVVAEGSIPSMEAVIDEVFKALEDKVGAGPGGFPTFDSLWEVVEDYV